jgi:hypothetical protein
MDNVAEPRNRADASARSGTEKRGWRVGEWSTSVGCSRALTYQLLAAGRIASVKLGAARIITTSPADFLASLGGETA